MRVGNERYKNQGIHVISAIFTVEGNHIKVLLIKRKNEPYKEKWALVGGALYNNEQLEDGVRREIFEKTGIKDVELYQYGVFDELGKTEDIPMRMVAIAYLGLIDGKKTKIIKENRNTVDVAWFDIDKVPDLAFSHNEILNKEIEKLRELILESNILKVLLPKEFSMPQLQRIYEGILNKTFDRRNFRKKILSLNIIDDTNKEISLNGNKPSKLYRFKDVIEDKKIF